MLLEENAQPLLKILGLNEALHAKHKEEPSELIPRESLNDFLSEHF